MRDGVSSIPAEDHGARAFYQDLHRTFDATVRRHAGTPQLIDALLSQAFDTFAGNLPMQCEGEPPLACHRGCPTCCTLRVSATAPEVFLVARFIAAILPGLEAREIDLLAHIRSTDQSTRGLSEVERVRLREFCPFMARGACVIYSVRPLACRSHASHDMRACVDAAAGRRDDIPYSNGHRVVRSLVQGAMQSTLRDAGLPWSAYELIHGVLLALDDPSAEAGWMKGADTLAAAALHDVSAAEMETIYDQLRP